AIEKSPLDFADEAEASGQETAAPRCRRPKRSSQGVAAAGDSGSENVSSPTEVGSPGSVYLPKWGVTNGSLLDTPEALAHREQRIQARESEIKNLKALLETEADMKRAAEEKSRRWVIGHGLRLATMKCAESLEMRQAFADV
nr:hypothetical protein [Tanacetum cinerariifolium]